MKISQLEALVEQFIQEKLVDEITKLSSKTGDVSGLTPDQLAIYKSKINKPGSAVDIVKPGALEEKKSKEEEAPTEEPAAPVEEPVDDSAPTQGLDALKADLQSVVSKLESMEDFKIGDKEDLKAKKLMNKIKLKLDDVVLIMDDLAAIKGKLDEQKEAEEQKAGDKFASDLQKMLKKRFKNPKDIEAVMGKYTATAKKYKHIEPKKVEEAIVRHMLKENAELKNNLK